MLQTTRLSLAIATCGVVTAAIAYADPTPKQQQLTPPPNAACEEEHAACPQQQPQPAPPPPPAAYPAPAAEHVPWYDRAGWALSAGGGGEDFAGGGPQTVTNVGGAWDVRLTMGTNWWVAGEASYFGSAQGLQDLVGVQNSAVLVGNGLQANARLNMTRNYFAQPFVYFGGAWRNYQVTNTNFNVSDVTDSANVFELPLGMGLAGYYRGFMGDLRAEYRWAWGDDLLIVGDNDMARWNASANIGYVFR